MRHVWMVVVLALAGVRFLSGSGCCPGQADRAEILELGQHRPRPSHGRDGPLG